VGLNSGVAFALYLFDLAKAPKTLFLSGSKSIFTLIVFCDLICAAFMFGFGFGKGFLTPSMILSKCISFILYYGNLTF